MHMLQKSVSYLCYISVEVGEQLLLSQSSHELQTR